jgi:hypothetical protein
LPRFKQIITDNWSFINWIDTKDMTDPTKQLSMYGFTEVEENTSVWTCTPGSVAEIPEVNELYDRCRDPFQGNNLLEREPEAASEVHEALMKFMLSLRALKA